MVRLLALLFLFQFKHLLADYFLQNEYMLGKFKKEGWIMPLAAHAGVHALMTFAICATFLLPLFLMGDLFLTLATVFLCAVLSGFDFVVHFIMDRIKASPSLLGRYKPVTKEQYIECKDILNSDAVFGESTINSARDKLDSNRKFWWSIGFDQMVHHLTHYIIIMFLI